MRKAIVFLALIPILFLAPLAVRYVQFYRLQTPDRTVPVYAPDVPAVPTPAATAFEDEPAMGEGLVLLDQAHENDFSLAEIGYLDGRLAARGYELQPYTGGDLGTALRSVDAFVVISPLDTFDRDEVQAVANFVGRGGRLLLIGDPARFNLLFDDEDFFAPPELLNDRIPLNSLANEFDIIYNGDYLYNTTENEGNFRNIILKSSGFAEDMLTDGLDQVVFYGSHSLQIGPSAEALLMGDDNTWSSATDRPGGLVLAALAGNGRVLALGDVNFLTEPYYTVFDNGRFITRIADFLTQPAEREFILADFPYFYADDINLVYLGAPDLGPNAFDEIISLQDAFRRVGKTLQLAGDTADGGSGLYLGIYNQAEEVAEALAAVGITLVIDPPLLTAEEEAALVEETADSEEDAPTEEEPAPDEEMPEKSARLIRSDLGTVQMSGTALILLQEQDGQQQVIVLAASNDGLEATVNRLLDLIPFNADYALADCLQQGPLALCPTGIVDEAVEAELLTGGTPTAEEGEDEPAAPGDGEEDPNSGGGAPGEAPEEIDAVNQGVIEFDTPVEGTLAADEAHSWSFEGGPAIINISVVGDDELDAVLEIYDPNNEFIAGADSSFAGGEEVLNELEVESGTYTIVVRDFFADGGSYTLTVTGEVTAVPPTDENGEDDITGLTILVYGDDEGLAATTGFTDADLFADLLSVNHTVTTWVASEDGVLSEEALADVDMLIWDSGDYVDEEGFFEDDTFAIIAFLDNGGELLVTGATPSLFGALNVSPLVDIELSGGDSVLLNGLASGDVYTLTEPFDTLIADTLEDDLGEDTELFAIRGPESNDAGELLGLAVLDAATNQRAVFMLLPFRVLPETLQGVMLSNIINWLYLDVDTP